MQSADSAKPGPVTAINGVSLLTQDGRLKSRYSKSERLRVMGATDDDLRATIDLFAPRGPLYAITRSGSDDPRDWTTARGRLRDGDVLRHLVGNLIPGQCPRWVAPKAWEATLWVGIDVDYRGDHEDYKSRCQQVQKALYVLGVPKKAWLVSRTPSGGRHYRFFMTRHIRTDDIPHVLQLVGLKESSGQVEVFPRRNKGMRLPFGHIPGRQHDPRKWLRFIRAWRADKFPRVNWLRCMRRAERHAQRQLEKGSAPDTTADSRFLKNTSRRTPRQETKREVPSTTFGMPRWKRHENGERSRASSSRERYMALLSRPFAGPWDAEELWKLGIQAEGTRVEATTRLAWHLTHVKRLPVKAAGDQLCQWVYQTGCTTSKDVRDDIRNDSRKVEQQTRELVEWCASNTDYVQPRGVFSPEEIDSILTHVDRTNADLSRDQVEFALSFLKFAKRHGRPIQDGWESQIAVRGIIRRWPGCSGMRYKAKMEWIVNSGLVEMTREKRQTNNGTGRPRTYLFRVPITPATGQTLGFSEAAQYAREQTRSKDSCHVSTGSQISESDTYGRIVPPLPQEKKGEVSEEAAQAERDSETTVPRSDSKLQPVRTESPQPDLENPKKQVKQNSNGQYKRIPSLIHCHTASVSGSQAHLARHSMHGPLIGPRRPCKGSLLPCGRRQMSLSEFLQSESARQGKDLEQDSRTSHATVPAQVKKHVAQWTLGRGPPV